MRYIEKKMTVPKLVNPNYFFVLTFIFGIAFLSCDGSYEPMDNYIEANVPFGIWVYAGTTGETKYYFRAQRFEHDKHGIAFKRENIYWLGKRRPGR